MIYNLPLRFTILHFAQRFRMDGDTFIMPFSLHPGFPAKVLIILLLSYSVQLFSTLFD